MHYGDKEHLEESDFKFVIYIHEKHDIAGHKSIDDRSYQFASIQSCRGFHPQYVRKMIKNPKKQLHRLGVNLDNFEAEEWYRVSLKMVADVAKLPGKSSNRLVNAMKEQYSFVNGIMMENHMVATIENVSISGSEYDRLH